MAVGCFARIKSARRDTTIPVQIKSQLITCSTLTNRDTCPTRRTHLDNILGLAACHLALHPQAKMLNLS